MAGAVAAAAAMGMVLGFGVRAGTPARGFNAIAALVLGDRAQGVWGWVSTVTLTGIAVLVAVMVGWGSLFALVVGRVRGWRLAAMALGVALGALVVSVAVVQRRLGADTVEVLGPGQLVGLHLMLAVTLAVGMRLARSSPRSDPQRRAAPPESPLPNAPSTRDDVEDVV